MLTFNLNTVERSAPLLTYVATSFSNCTFALYLVNVENSIEPKQMFSLDNLLNKLYNEKLFSVKMVILLSETLTIAVKVYIVRINGSE